MHRGKHNIAFQIFRSNGTATVLSTPPFETLRSFFSRDTFAIDIHDTAYPSIYHHRLVHSNDRQSSLLELPRAAVTPTDKSESEVRICGVEKWGVQAIQAAVEL